ncbi:8591_t:CDS:1, partial [Racocetra fulgida]
MADADNKINDGSVGCYIGYGTKCDAIFPESVPLIDMVTSQAPIAGQNITFNLTNVLLNGSLTTEHHIDIILESQPNLVKYSQQICIGNNTWCPIPTEKTVEIIVEITVPDYFDVSTFSVYLSNFYKIDNDDCTPNIL